MQNAIKLENIGNLITLPSSLKLEIRLVHFVIHGRHTSMECMCAYRGSPKVNFQNKWRKSISVPCKQRHRMTIYYKRQKSIDGCLKYFFRNFFLCQQYKLFFHWHLFFYFISDNNCRLLTINIVSFIFFYIDNILSNSFEYRHQLP
jgi:hypothetical protein